MNFVNTDLNIIQNNIGDQSPLASYTVKRGNVLGFPFQFVTQGQVYEIDPLGAGDLAIRFGAKVIGTYNGKYVVSNWNKIAQNFVYTKTFPGTFNDGVSVNNNATFSSATASFSQADVGNAISGTNIPAGTTILAVAANGASCTLSNNATASGGGITFVIGNRPTTYTVPLGLNTTKLNNLLGYDPDGFAEVTDIVCEADVAGSLNGKYFVMQDVNGSVGVWINLNNGATAEPAGAAACTRAIEVTTINTNDSAETVATKLAAVFNADAEYTAESWSNLLTVTDKVIGPRATPAADGAAPYETGFTITRDIAGSAPDTLDEVPSVTLNLEFTWFLNGNPVSSQTISLIVNAAINNGNEGIPGDANPAYPAPANIIPFYPLITGLGAGGGPTTITGIPTACLSTLSAVQFVIAGALKTYQLQAGGGGIQGADYNAVTNNRSWYEVL